MPTKELLMIPGPTPVPDRVLRAMAAPMVNHRGEAFAKVFDEVTAGLKKLYLTDNEVMVIPAAGTGGLEAAVVNFLSPGERVLALVTGVFGERWVKIARAYGAEVEVIETTWDQAVNPAEVARRLADDPSGRIKAVLVTHNETSTGVTNPLKELAAAAAGHPALMMVDAVSSLGAIPLRPDAWGLDVVVTGSQKAMMVPPGLAFLSVSPKAWERAAAATNPKFYWDLTTYRKQIATRQTPYTPAVSLWFALREALAMIEEEGLEAAWRRHALLGTMTRAGVTALGLDLLANPEHASDTVTAIQMPAGIEAKALRSELRKKYGVVVAGGQGKLTDSIFRIGHVGWVDPKDILQGLAALELALDSLGYPVTLGAGVAAAQKAWKETQLAQKEMR